LQREDLQAGAVEVRVAIRNERRADLGEVVHETGAEMEIVRRALAIGETTAQVRSLAVPAGVNVAVEPAIRALEAVTE
jgi:hypothetical protein